MRIVKYLTLSILLCAVLILAETTRLLYTVNFAFGSMRAYYEVQITQEDLPVISELSGQYGIPLCIVENKMATTQAFDIYSTTDESTLVDELQIQFGTFRSVFYKESVQIRFHAFEDYEVPEKPVKLFFVGNQRQDFEKALSSQVTIQGGIMYQQDASTMLAVIWIAWGILIAFAFFLSAFDAESKRRTSFVRIMNGASPLQILLANIGVELLAMTGIISIVTAVTGCFVTVQIGKYWQVLVLLVRKNLELVQKKSRSDMSLDDALRRVGMTNYLDKKVCTLSGGEQQRIALARLMVKKCSIVLADEPTGSLDADNAAKVMKILSDLNAMGKTVVMVTHDTKYQGIGTRQIDLMKELRSS